jgi:hypothetical protein
MPLFRVMRSCRGAAIALLLLLLAGPLGLEGVAHDAHHGPSAPPDDCPLCMAAKMLAADVVPEAPSLGADIASDAPPLPASAPRASLAPAAPRGRSPPPSS